MSCENIFTDKQKLRLALLKQDWDDVNLIIQKGHVDVVAMALTDIDLKDTTSQNLENCFVYLIERGFRDQTPIIDEKIWPFYVHHDFRGCVNLGQILHQTGCLVLWKKLQDFFTDRDIIKDIHGYRGLIKKSKI